MSLNNLKLSSALLAELYHKVLIETHPASVPAIQPVRFLGNNEKSILIVIADETVPFLVDEDLHLLTSILSACNLSLADVAIVNRAHDADADCEKIFDQLHTKKTVLFGVDPERFGLPINFPQFQLQQFAGKEFLYAPALSHLKDDKEIKKQLWSALKKMFSV